MKRIFATHPAHRIAQEIDFANQQIVAVTFEQVYGEEPSAAGDEGASVVGHVRLP